LSRSGKDWQGRRRPRTASPLEDSLSRVQMRCAGGLFTTNPTNTRNPLARKELLSLFSLSGKDNAFSAERARGPPRLRTAVRPRAPPSLAAKRDAGTRSFSRLARAVSGRLVTGQARYAVEVGVGAGEGRQAVVLHHGRKEGVVTQQAVLLAQRSRGGNPVGG